MVINEKLLPKDVNTDSGWIQVTSYDGNFANYNSSSGTYYRKWGKIVQVVGQVKTTTALTSGTIFTLPTGFRPPHQTYAIAQGSGVYKWLVSVSADGRVICERYGTTSQTSISTSSWLAFSIMFIVE